MKPNRYIYDTYSDNELLFLLRNSDEQAFAALYDRYWDRVFYMAMQRLKIASCAEDAVQDVFADIWKRRGELEIKSSFPAYLAVAVKYRIINIQAKMNHATRYGQEIIRNINDSCPSTEEWLDFKELRERLETHIATLPEKARIAFQLNHEGGLRHKEIARAMQVSEKAVERSIARAIQSLMASFRHFTSFF